MASRKPYMRKQTPSTAGPRAKKAAEEYITKKQVKMMIAKSSELKAYDNGGAVSTTSAPVISHQSPIAQGSGQSQRVGNEITVSHAEISYKIQAGDNYNWVRVIYFQWHEDNAISVPTTADILFSPASTDNSMNLLHFDERHRFKVIYDKVHKVEAQSTGTYAFVKDLRVKIPNKTITYNGTLGTGTNQIYVWVASDSNAVPNPSFVNQFRLLYRDA